MLVAALKSLNVSYPAAPRSVPKARNAVVELGARGGAGDEEQDAIRLAVSEAVSNAVVHAYADGAGGDGEVLREIHITAGFAKGELWVLVADDGCGFQTPSRNPGLGWGMPLIAHMTDGLEIAERAEGGTEVRMRFTIQARSADR